MTSYIYSHLCLLEQIEFTSQFLFSDRHDTIQQVVLVDLQCGAVPSMWRFPGVGTFSSGYRIQSELLRLISPPDIFTITSNG